AQAAKAAGRPPRRHQRRGRPRHPRKIEPADHGGPHLRRGGGPDRRPREGGCVMAILIDKSTKILVQGFTGEQATFHARQCLSYGSEIVAGVTPGKGRTVHLDRPVFDTVAEAVAKTGADASL